jgi:hypothetical protein
VTGRSDPMVRGRQLAADGHVRIIARDPAHVRAIVRSGSDPDRTYRVTFDGWHCDCPATVRHCAHVQAVRLTTGARDLEAHPLGRWWEDRTGGQVPSGTSPQPARSGSNAARLSQPRPGGPPC